MGTTKLAKVDAGALNGLYSFLLVSGRRPSSRTGKGYSPDVLARALELRNDGLTLAATATRLRTELPEAEHITKDTLASLLRRDASNTSKVVEPVETTGLNARTVNYIHTVLHRAFKDAVRWGRLARNPADAADPPRAGQKGIEGWDAPTLRTFLTRSRESDDRLHALWVLLATTGMRRGEAIGLRWADIDLDVGRLRVVQQITQVRSKIIVGEPKTTSSRRGIALDPATVAVLRQHRKQMLTERLMLGADFVDHGLVFHDYDGSALHPDSVSAKFSRRVAEYGLPALTIHGLRHTWATLALEQGIHPKVVQERLGHSSIAITLGIYSHVTPRLHDEAANQVASLFL